MEILVAIVLFALGLMVGGTLNRMAASSSETVPKRFYDSACEQRDHCLAEWNKSIDLTVTLTKSLNRMTEIVEKGNTL